MSSAVRVGVPLKSRCSRKWVEPKREGTGGAPGTSIASASSRDPTATQYPRVALRAPGTCSLRMRTPLGSTVRLTRASPEAANERSARPSGRSTALFIVSTLRQALFPARLQNADTQTGLSTIYC